MKATAQIGVTGLAVMGRNLARNFARNGYTVAVHNRTPHAPRHWSRSSGTRAPSWRPSPPRISWRRWSARAA